MDWSFIESVNCITIDNSKNIHGFKENLAKVGLGHLVKIWTFPKVVGVNAGDDKCKGINLLGIFKNKGAYCCNQTCQEISKSHKKIINWAYNANLRNILIFEDDARFNIPFDKNKLNRVMKWLKDNNTKWDVFYFGHISVPFPLGYPVARDITRVYKPVLTHAYIINRSAMKTILSYQDDSYIDVKIAYDESIRKYCIFPSICNQYIEPHIYNKIGTVSKIIPFQNLVTIGNYIEYYSPLILLLFFIAMIMILQRR